MRSKNQNYTDLGKIHWKKALDDELNSNELIT